MKRILADNSSSWKDILAARQVGYCVLLGQQRILHPNQSKKLLVKMLHLCLFGAIAHGMQAEK